MKKQISTLAVAALCGISLSFLAAPSAYAQETAKIVVTAHAEESPSIEVWIDTDQSSALDAAAANTFQEAFGSTDWTVLDNHTLVVSKNGKALFSAGVRWNEDRTFFEIHGRFQQDGVVTVLDGVMIRDLEDPEFSFAELILFQPLADGSIRTIKVSADLSFSS